MCSSSKHHKMKLHLLSITSWIFHKIWKINDPEPCLHLVLISLRILPQTSNWRLLPSPHLMHLSTSTPLAIPILFVYWLEFKFSFLFSLHSVSHHICFHFLNILGIGIPSSPHYIASAVFYAIILLPWSLTTLVLSCFPCRSHRQGNYLSNTNVILSLTRLKSPISTE